MSFLVHYGIKRRSGRYPWGSGKDAYRRNPDIRAEILEMRQRGMKDKDIAKAFGWVDRFGEGNIKRLRDEITLAKAREDATKITQANKLYEKYKSPTEVGKIMGLNESSVRSLLDPFRQERALRVSATIEMLKEQMRDKPYLDVGKGVELDVGVNRTLLDAAIRDLENNGYKIQYVNTTQLGTGKETRMKILTKDDVPYRELVENKDQIRTIQEWSEDGGQTYNRLEPVQSIDSNRVQVRFKEDGGGNMDGVLQLRRGVEDLSLGDKHHAQVRVEVDGTHYMKGMAIYADNMPEGIDIVYNSSKSQDVGKMGAMKPNETDDPTNPFGTTIRQKHYIDSEGNEQLSPLNRVGYSSHVEAGEEGYWDSWNKDLSSQFLGKQNIEVIQQQLDLGLEIQKDRFEDIKDLTNPAVRQRLLDTFADDCDSKAVHLAGAALPRQCNKVILPLESLKENEVFAPGFDNGEELILVRYPHAGTFEIPKVEVNNKNPEGLSVIGNDNRDAIGIHPETAKTLSGADFDGDHVIAIPYNDRLEISQPLKDLQDFDNKSYRYSDEVLSDPNYKKISDRTKDFEMGKVSNLITDMTLKGADPDEIARAVRHSMVVIDAQKHDLNYRQSEADNRIKELKEKYQGHIDPETGRLRVGASTILSRASSEETIDQTRPLRRGDEGYENVVRRGEYSVDIETGAKVTVPVDPKNGYQPKQRSTRMQETSDAMTLVSDNPTPKEITYANYANEMKSLGDQARLESIRVQPLEYSPSAKAAYELEVRSLDAKLTQAERNAPLERQAQLLADSTVRAKRNENPNLTAEQIRKISGHDLEVARNRVGAGKLRVEITEREWEAIQAGAVRASRLERILNNSRIEDLQRLATPRQQRGMSDARVARAKSMLRSGYTIAEVAQSLGVSAATIGDLRR